MVQSEISVDVESFVEPDVQLRRFRWRLKDCGSSEYTSPNSFATKREAVREGEVALQRAIQRGRVRP